MDEAEREATYMGFFLSFVRSFEPTLFAGKEGQKKRMHPPSIVERTKQLFLSKRDFGQMKQQRLKNSSVPLIADAYLT